MWFDAEIEKAAIYSYYNDPWTEEDYEIMGVPIPQSGADDGEEGIEM